MLETEEAKLPADASILIVPPLPVGLTTLITVFAVVVLMIISFETVGSVLFAVTVFSSGAPLTESASEPVLSAGSSDET